MAARHPGLRFVDFISFAGRARGLLQGRDLVHPLYPVGYPAALVGARWIAGDVLLAGKALAVVAGAGAVAVTARWIGAGAAAWLLAQAVILEWGATEGTDLGAAAFGLAAVLAAADRRPALAGALAGLGCLVRYTGVAAVPVAMVLAGRPAVFLSAFAVATAPHWALALALGRPVLPDQGFNLAIAHARPVGLLSWDTLRRWPFGLVQAGVVSFSHPAVIAGGVGLLAGAWRRDRRAFALLGFALTHVGLLALAFSNPRLALPATLCAALGAAWLLPSRWLALPALALGAWNLRSAAEVGTEERALAEIVAATAELQGPFLASSPWFHQHRDGWIEASVPLREAAPNPRALDPAALARFARDRGFATVVVEGGRIHATYPGLAPLLRTPPPDGYRLAVRTRRWRALQVPPVSDHDN